MQGDPRDFYGLQERIPARGEKDLDNIRLF